MTRLLIRLFVPNSADIANNAVRRNYVTLGSSVGIACNLLLFLLKLAIGLLSGSVSVMADAFNNLSDIGSSVVTAIGFRLSVKPADKEHPFGHGRMEYMSALVVAIFIILVGFELLKTSIDKIIHPTELQIGWYTLAILVASIGLKLWMFFFHRKLGRTIGSSALIATAQDSGNDAISTSAVLVSILVFYFFKINIDPYIGLAVAIFIMYSGGKTIKDTLDPLLGMPPEQETIDQINEIIHSYDEFLGIHDLIVHNYGPGRSFASLHVEVSADTNIVACHEIIDACEKRMLSELGLEVVIHMDPIATNDATTLKAKESVTSCLQIIDPRLTLHDFRMVDGERQINLIFDVVIPNGFSDTDQQLKEKISQAVKQLDERYEVVLTLDRDYISHL